MQDIITGTISGLISSFIMLFIDKQTIIGLFKDSKEIQKLENKGATPKLYSYFSSSYSSKTEIKITEKYRTPASSDDPIGYFFLFIIPVILFIVFYVSFIEKIAVILTWMITTIIFLIVFTSVRYIRASSKFKGLSKWHSIISFYFSTIIPTALLIYFLVGYKSVSKGGVNIIDISRDVNLKTSWDFSALSKTIGTFTEKFNFLKDNYAEFTPVFIITLIGMVLSVTPIIFAVRNIKSMNSLLTASLKLNPKPKILKSAELATPKIFWTDSIISTISLAIVYILLSGYWEDILNYIVKWLSN